MIAKTTIGRSFKGCVGYTMAKVEQGRGEILLSQGVRDYDRRAMVADFTRQAKQHPELTRSVWHTAVSFSPQDEARLQQQPQLMEAIARDYVKGMGLEKSQYVVIRHRDTAHSHFHLVANRVGDDGQVVSDSHNFSRSERLLRQLEVKYGLTPMMQQEGRKSLQNVPERDRQRIAMRDQVRQCVKVATNGTQLQDELSRYGIRMVVNRGQDGSARGVSFEREEKDGQGQPVRIAFKGSKLHQGLGIRQLTQQLQANKQAHEQRQAQQTTNSPTRGQTARQSEEQKQKRGFGRGM